MSASAVYSVRDKSFIPWKMMLYSWDNAPIVGIHGKGMPKVSGISPICLRRFASSVKLLTSNGWLLHLKCRSNLTSERHFKFIQSP